MPPFGVWSLVQPQCLSSTTPPSSSLHPLSIPAFHAPFPSPSALNFPFNPRPSLRLRSSTSSGEIGDGPQVANAGVEKKREFSVPVTIEESVEQAQFACKQAQRDGLRRLQLELLLPLIGATDLDDWPGGIQQQFKAAGPVVSALLKGLIDMNDLSQENAFKRYIIDEGDAVGVWEAEKVALVLFPTADCLEKVKDLSGIEDRMLLLVNPQWQSGQVISDFGFGTQRRLREEFVKSFATVYYLKQLRILGENVRLLKCYPSYWQVFVVDSGGRSECVAVEIEKPSYKRLQDILKNREGSKAGQSWLGRLLGELRFNQDSLNRN